MSKMHGMRMTSAEEVLPCMQQDGRTEPRRPRDGRCQIQPARQGCQGGRLRCGLRCLRRDLSLNSVEGPSGQQRATYTRSLVVKKI